MVAPAEKSYWIDSLNSIARKGSELIVTHGWVQDSMVGDDGELCIVSAGHKAAHVIENPGLSHVLREVLDHLDHAENWNNLSWRKDYEVIDYLDRLKVTEEVLEETFGPGWEVVCHLCNLFGKLSEEDLTFWLNSWDEMKDYRMLQHLDEQQAPDQREARARTAVCATMSHRCQEFGLKPNGPSAGLLTATLVRPSLVP